MNRADELTGRLIDGALTDAEAAELDALLAADPAARGRHVTLLNLEAALRGLRTDLNLGAETVARIEADRAGRTAAAVVAEIAHRPPPAWRRRRSRGVRVAAAHAALAAAVLVAVWASGPPAPVPPPARPAPPPALARVTAVTGSVELLDRGNPVPLGADFAVAPGQTLRTVGEDSGAVVEFPDHTRVELHPETAVRFAADEAGEAPRKMFLVQGWLTANVLGRTAVVATDGADVVARRGEFSLWSSGPGSVRVELREGDVQVVRGEAFRPVPLSPGGAAFVRDELTPVRLEAAWRTDTAPRDQHELRALDVAFAPDGREVWATTAKQFVRWRLGPDGRGAGADRQMYSPPCWNDGHVALFTADLRKLVACRVDDREDRTLIRELPGGAVRQTIPVRVSEPRFVCVSPDGGWVGTLSNRQGNRVRVWDAETGAERFARDVDNSAFTVAASPDGRRLVAELPAEGGRKDGNRLAFLDAETGETAFALPTRRRTATAVAFSPDGTLMAAGFNGAVQVWDVPGRKLVRTIVGFERAVSRLAFDPAANRLAAGTQDGQVWVWSATTGRRTQVIQTGTRGVRALAFSPDGRSIVTATNRAPTAIWDVAAEPADRPEPDL